MCSFVLLLGPWQSAATGHGIGAPRAIVLSLVQPPASSPVSSLALWMSSKPSCKRRRFRKEDPDILVFQVLHFNVAWSFLVARDLTLDVYFDSYHTGCSCERWSSGTVSWARAYDAGISPDVGHLLHCLRGREDTARGTSDRLSSGWDNGCVGLPTVM